MPKLEIVLALSPIVTNIFYISLISSLIFITLIICFFFKRRKYFKIYPEDQNYLTGIYSFVDNLTTKIQKIINNTIAFFREEKKLKISRLKLFLIIILFVVLGLIIIIK